MTDRYQIISLLEKDPLGSVYLAHDVTLQRRVIFREFDKKDVGGRTEGFSQYTGKLCALQHPNILTIFDISIEGEECFMVTQLIEGESLESRLSQGALNQVGVHNMACDLLDALHTAHSSGLYHGALRTDSIKRLPRVRGGHRYLIVDFGLDRISSMICGKSVFMADPVLMAPELLGGKVAPNGASDLFTLGQLCYIALVGGHPYAGKTPEECAQAYRDGGLPHLNTYVQGVRSDFADWVMWLISGAIENRPANSEVAMKALHVIKLNAPAPNVPGMTQALEVPESPRPKPLSYQEAVKSVVAPKIVADKPRQRSTVNSPGRPKSAALGGGLNELPQDRRFFVGAIGVVVVLLVLLALVFVLRGKDGVQEGGEKVQVQPEKPMVVLGKVKVISQVLAHRELLNIPLDAGQAIDWTVVTGAPASSARVMMRGGDYIRNILAVGRFTEFIEPHEMLTYSAGGAVITPQRGMTNVKKGRAQSGEGWEVALRVPPAHQGALQVTMFMIRNGCDFEIEVRSTAEKNKNKVVHLHIPEGHPGVVRIPLKFAKPDVGYYSIRILAGAEASEEKGFEMGLSAVLLELAE